MYEKASRRRGKLVGPLADKPDLLPAAQPFWDAFWVLHGSRGASMGGPMPIPLTEMLAWCDLRGIEDSEDRMELLQHIRTMDAVYLERSHARTDDQS